MNKKNSGKVGTKIIIVHDPIAGLSGSMHVRDISITITKPRKKDVYFIPDKKIEHPLESNTWYLSDIYEFSPKIQTLY